MRSVGKVPTNVSGDSDAKLRADSVAIDEKLQAVAKRIGSGPTYELLRTLHLCAPCNHLERFGEDNDGGYVMCTDDLDHGLVAAYSYGINGFDGWGMQVASRYHISLHEYDCTNSKQPSPCEGCAVHFHSECIKSAKDTSHQPNYETLSQQLSANDNLLAASGSLLLKIDVEGAEWKVFADEAPNLLKKFREIVVEYHGFQHVDQHELYLRAVQNVERAGFAVAHLHGNNNEAMWNFDEFKIPQVLEVTYIQKSVEGCASAIQYRSPLDQPNSVKKPELPDAVLPKF